MTTAAAPTDLAPLIISLSEDQLAEIADVCAWIADGDRNDPTNYPGAGWDARDDGPWHPGDRWALAAAE